MKRSSIRTSRRLLAALVLATLLKPGSRIISDDFDMRGAKPKEVVHLPRPQADDNGEPQNTLYKWVVPWEAE